MSRYQLIQEGTKTWGNPLGMCIEQASVLAVLFCRESQPNLLPPARLGTVGEKAPETVVAHYGTDLDSHLLPLYSRPYGKDVPRLDYWLAYETIMKKFGGRPHWAKVNIQTFPLHP